MQHVRASRPEDTVVWGRRGGRALRVAALFALLAVLGGQGSRLSAQERSALITQLENGLDFRVRVQAAFAMGNLHDPQLVQPLSRALRDANPAVRAAAAAALARIGDRSAIPALRAVSGDTSAAVRMQVQRAISTLEAPPAAQPMVTASPVGAAAPSSGVIAWETIRWVVHVGDMRNRSNFAGDELARRMQQEVETNLRSVRGVAVLGGAITDTTRREISRRRLPELQVEGSVVRVDRRVSARDLAVRCEVSFMLLDHPGHNMRGAMSGAATGSEALGAQRAQQELRLANQALSGAVRSAMSQAPTAIQRATSR